MNADKWQQMSTIKILNLKVCHNDGGPLNLECYMPTAGGAEPLYITMTVFNSAFTLRLGYSIFTSKEYEHTNVHISPVLRGQSICGPQGFRTRTTNSFII